MTAIGNVSVRFFISVLYRNSGPSAVSRAITFFAIDSVKRQIGPVAILMGPLSEMNVTGPPHWAHLYTGAAVEIEVWVLWVVTSGLHVLPCVVESRCAVLTVGAFKFSVRLSHCTGVAFGCL